MHGENAAICGTVWKAVFVAAFNGRAVLENHERGAVVEMLLGEFEVFLSNGGFSRNFSDQTSLLIDDVLRVVNFSDGCLWKNFSCELERREFCGERIFADQHSVTADV